MANLIRLKQIESGSELGTAATVGADFSASVIAIVSDSVVAVLPDGVVSSSAQIELISASGYQQLATDLEVSVVSSSISTSIGILSQTYVTTSSLNLYTSSVNSSLNSLSASTSTSFGSINNSIETISGSLDMRVDALEYFSATLDNTYATDAELLDTSSQILDQGEW